MSEDPKRDRRLRIDALNYDYGAQPKMPIVACNLCGADNWVVITHRDRYGFPARAMTCGDCGLTTLNPRMTPEAYRDFYASTYRPLVSAFHGRLIDARTIQEDQRAYAAQTAHFVAPMLAERSLHNMLDVGGSTGIVANFFAQTFRWQATVIDPAPAEVEVASRLGIRTVAGFVETWEPAEAFDFIGMFQTIDHLLDVGTTLRKLRSVITPQGLFFVDIVDFRAACLRNRCVEQAIKIDHVFYLTEPTTEAFLRRAGFRPLRKCYSADHLHIAYICQPCAPEPALIPDPGETRLLLREIRQVQNGPPPRH